MCFQFLSSLPLHLVFSTFIVRLAVMSSASCVYLFYSLLPQRKHEAEFSVLAPSLSSPITPPHDLLPPLHLPWLFVFRCDWSGDSIFGRRGTRLSGVGWRGTEWLGVVLILSGSRLVSSLRLVKAECYRISCCRRFVRGSYLFFQRRCCFIIGVWSVNLYYLDGKIWRWTFEGWKFFRWYDNLIRPRMD